MHDEIFARMYNQVLLNRAYLKTILANQCIILARSTNKPKNHKQLFDKFNKQVFLSYRQLLHDDRKAVTGSQKKRPD